MSLRVMGIDAAFSNCGIAKGRIGHLSGQLESIDSLTLIKTEADKSKQVRKSSSDMARAKVLYQGLSMAIEPPCIIFAEIPSGTQSARASWALGIAVGVMAAINCEHQIIQVTAREVKLASVGSQKASKKEMIAWAHDKHPSANWLLHGGKLTLANEHLADAIACIYAGMQTDEFQRYLSMTRAVHSGAA